MKTVSVTFESISPYSQSKKIQDIKPHEETARDFEARTWKQRCHVNKDGNIFIPPMAFKNCIAEAAKFLGVQIPGKGKSNYTKHFEAGLLVIDPLVLPVKVDDVEGEWLFVPSDGKRGGSKRVDKCFPLISAWEGPVVFHVLDDTITKEVFEFHAHKMGAFIGVGRFRPRNNGFYGRFKPVKFEWN